MNLVKIDKIERTIERIDDDRVEIYDHITCKVPIEQPKPYIRHFQKEFLDRRMKGKKVIDTVYTAPFK